MGLINEQTVSILFCTLPLVVLLFFGKNLYRGTARIGVLNIHLEDRIIFRQNKYTRMIALSLSNKEEIDFAAQNKVKYLSKETISMQLQRTRQIQGIDISKTYKKSSKSSIESLDFSKKVQVKKENISQSFLNKLIHHHN